MENSERVGKVIFLTAPLLGAAIGYRCMGWFGALVYAIAAWPMLSVAFVSFVIVGAGFKYCRDRKRVSLLSTELLHKIVLNPKTSDFRFAFAELEARGEDVGIARQLLLGMLKSNDRRERELGLARLQELYPKLCHGSAPSIEDAPGELHAWVTDVLAKSS